jgi:amidase
LRNPASFNGIVGFRPSIGRVAHTPEGSIDMNLGQQGPMARNVEDVRAAARRDVRRRPARSLLAAAHRRVVSRCGALGWRPKRVAWSADLGVTMADKEVAAITRKRGGTLRELGATVEEAHPDLSGLHRVLHHAAHLRLLHAQGRACCASTASCSSRE